MTKIDWNGSLFTQKGENVMYLGNRKPPEGNYLTRVCLVEEIGTKTEYVRLFDEKGYSQYEDIKLSNKRPKVLIDWNLPIVSVRYQRPARLICSDMLTKTRFKFVVLVTFDNTETENCYIVDEYGFITDRDTDQLIINKD